MATRDDATTAFELGRGLMLAGTRLRDTVGRRVQRECGITALQGELLLLMAEHGSMIPTELAAACGVNASTVTHAVDAGIEHGLMRRDRDAADRRLVNIALTAAGKRTATRVRALITELAAGALEGIGAPGREGLGAGLAAVANNLQRK